jgi:urocanate hydratase
VAAIADAAMRAAILTGDDAWEHVVDMAVNWFLGNNDSGHSMIDLHTGGGYDGLHIDGVNLNQGAESTLAMVSTMQHRGSMWLV